MYVVGAGFGPTDVGGHWSSANLSVTVTDLGLNQRVDKEKWAMTHWTAMFCEIIYTNLSTPQPHRN